MIPGLKLNGKEEAIPATHILRAGEFSMLYENGNLRYISAGGYEIIRMIYFAVRDKDWLTISPVIDEEKISRKKNGFEIGYKAHYRYNEIDFKAEISIFSAPANRLILEMKGAANSTFLKNRIGFCVLHPISNCAGHECRIIHPDNSVTIHRFPEEISPHQPFKNICSMSWKVNDSIGAMLHFDGDIFETEDQRNWTDASFKTYSTPLDQPYPVEVAQGTSISQRVEFALEGECPAEPIPGPVFLKPRESVITFNVGKHTSVKLPAIGVSVSSRHQPLTMYEAGILKIPGFSHIRGELHLFSMQLEKQYAILTGESAKANLPAEVCLLFGNEPLAELARFLSLYHQIPVEVARIIVLSGNDKVASANLLSMVMPVIRREFNNIPAGTGTNCNFAQLNRSRPGFSGIDFVSFTLHPQEHASDERTLTENTAAQLYTVQSASKFEIHKPVIVSPVTLQRRFNANCENYEEFSDINIVPPGVDPRQMSLFGAAWTVGSLKSLLDSEITSITYYESVGERGLFMGEKSSRWPDMFKADSHMIFPVYHIFRLLLNKAKFRVQGSYSTNPMVIDGFCVECENSGMLFLSNMTRQLRKVRLSGIDEYDTILRINAGSFNALTRNFQFPVSAEEIQMAANTGERILQPYETLILEYRL
jgi:D-apionolactonase